MAYDEKLAERVRKMLLSGSVAFAEKKMMGGLCLMVDGKMCVGIEKDRLMVRIDPVVYEAALRRKGCRPMDFTGRPMRGFVFVTPEGFSTSRELAYWIDLAIEFNPRANSSKKKHSNRPSKKAGQRPKTSRPKRGRSE